MASAFLGLAILCLLAAVASWVMAVVEGLKVMADDRAGGFGSGLSAWALLVFWPFALRGRAANAEAHTARTNKATIAFFVSITLAVAATSVYTNLTLRPKLSPEAPGAAPSKS